MAKTERIPRSMEEAERRSVDVPDLLWRASLAAEEGVPPRGYRALLADLLTHPDRDLRDVRRALRVLGRWQACGFPPTGLRREGAIAMRRLLRAEQVDGAVIDAWLSTLVPRPRPEAVAVLRSMVRAWDAPEVGAWEIHRRAAKAMLRLPGKSPLWKKGERALVEGMASDDMEQRWRAAIRLGRLRLSRRALEAMGPDEVPAGAYERPARCPECGREDRIRWFHEVPPRIGHETRTAVCVRCRVVLTHRIVAFHCGGFDF